MNEKTLVAIGVVVLGLAITVGFMIWRGPRPQARPSAQSAPAVRSQPSAPQTAPTQRPRRKSRCGAVSTECIAKVEEYSSPCSELQASRRLRKILQYPLQVGDCRGVDSTLHKRCMKGCSFDPASFLVVPGQIEISLTVPEDERGNCVYEGKRAVSLRGVCR